MSISANNIVRSVMPYSKFESARNVVSSTFTCNQGDLIAFDTTNHVLKVVASEITDSPNFLGVSPVKIVNGKIASPYNTDVVASQAVQDLKGPVAGVVALLILKTADALNPGQKVYLDPASGAQNVTATAGTSPIGIYQGPAIASAVAGQQIEVYIEANY